MPFQIALPIVLRLGATAAFLIAVIVAGAINRAVVIVPLLAAAATLTQYVAGRIAPGPLAQLGAALDAKATSTPSFNRLWLGFLLGSAGYAVLFILTVFLSAMFQQTELERALGMTDLWILAAPTLAALLLSVINSRTSASQVSGMMSNLQSAFSEQSPANDGEPFTVEGEIIEPDDQHS